MYKNVYTLLLSITNTLMFREHILPMHAVVICFGMVKFPALNRSEIEVSFYFRCSLHRKDVNENTTLIRNAQNTSDPLKH